MTTPTTATDVPPEKKKKERKPRATSKYIVIQADGVRQPLNEDDKLGLKEALELLDLPTNLLDHDSGMTLAIIHGAPQNGIKDARKLIVADKVSGKRILIACVRRDGSATPVNGVELKGL